MAEGNRYICSIVGHRYDLVGRTDFHGMPLSLANFIFYRRTSWTAIQYNAYPIDIRNSFSFVEWSKQSTAVLFKRLMSPRISLPTSEWSARPGLTKNRIKPIVTSSRTSKTWQSRAAQIVSPVPNFAVNGFLNLYIAPKSPRTGCISDTLYIKVEVGYTTARKTLRDASESSPISVASNE